MAKVEASEAARQQAQGFAATNDEALEGRIAEVHARLFGGAALTVESCDVQEHLVRNEFQRRVDAEAKQQERLKERILLAMQSFRTAYPAESTETRRRSRSRRWRLPRCAAGNNGERGLSAS